MEKKGKATCYAWGYEGEWQALCVDFDLVAHGRSFEEVREEIQDAIETYVSYVVELPDPDRARLLSRKAPLGLRLKLEFLCRIYSLLNLLRVRLARRYDTFQPAVAWNTA